MNRPHPGYTEDARNNKVEGKIIALALVGVDGLVGDMKLVTHLPDGLDDEAKLGIQQMRFRPATKGRQPVANWVTLEVEFHLR